MAIDPITAVSSLVETVVNRIWPDATERDKAKLAIEQLRVSGELQRMAAETGLLHAQIEVNKVEAGSPSVFVAGWRPFIGWVGGAGLAWEFVINPVAVWSLAVAGSPIQSLPSLHSAELVPLVMALLGIGAMRSFEKSQGLTK